MKTLKTSRVTWFGLASVVVWLVTVSPGTAHAQWTTLTNAPPNYLSTCLQLTDGSAMCHRYNTNQWWRLIPDNLGSYADGTWSATAPMPDGTDTSGSCAPCVYAPLYYASAVLPDGRVVVVGGEYNSNGLFWTNIGFLYNPVTDTWSSQLVVPFPTGSVGDIQTVVLDNGTMLIASIGTNIAEFDPTTLTFTGLNPINKLDNNNEENWNILPDGRVLTVDTRIASSFEIYDPGLNTWTSGTTPVNLVDCCGAADGVGNSKEAGPGVLRPDGTLVYFSGNPTGQNAVYDTVAGTWTHSAAMDFPLVPSQTYHYAVADGPASLLPNGNVLVMASPVINGSPFNTPSHFYEFDGTNLTQVTDTPNAASFRAYQGRMLLLPSGQVLLTAYNQAATQDVVLYSNGGSPQNAWRPVITSGPSTVTAGNTYAISGRLFNGFSEGATYGDDAAMSSNYPLVRIKNLATSHVVYARTHDHTSMGVELVGSLAVVSTQFDVPAGVEAGQSELVVVVNGISSLPVTVNVNVVTVNVNVAICHKPATPAQKTLVLPVKALAGHLGHGDTVGPCQ
jgi:Kelch motif